MSTAIVLIAVTAIFTTLFFLFSDGKSNSKNLEKDAERFAGLLISEIKLYETYKYQRGLKNNNLYESLRVEIGEARKKYGRRFSNSELEAVFDETLVNVLANGDESKLGSFPVYKN